MFTSLFTNVASGLQIADVGLAFLAAILTGFYIALIYSRVEEASSHFLMAICVIPSIVMMIILLVNGNLGIGVAVAGSFSLIRFRSLPGKATDIVMIFLAMASGLAYGTGYVLYGLISVVIIGLIVLALGKISPLAGNDRVRAIRITVPEDLNFTGMFDEILNKYATNIKLVRVKTVNMGALYQLDYQIKLRDVTKEKELLDEIRVRNGNLTVQSCVAATSEEL